MKKLVIFALAMTISTAFANFNADENESSQVEQTVIAKVSPFCMAIVKGDVDMVKKMISLGADVNKFSKGMAPVMYAARYNRVEILKVLVRNGADIYVKDKLGNTALQYAELANAFDAMLFLEQKGDEELNL